MYYKKLISSALFLIISTVLHAQVAEQHLISTAGDVYNSESLTMEFTLGEIVTETFHNEQLILTQGFIQPNKIITHYQLHQTNPIQVKVYPNPIIAQTNIEITNFSNELNLTLLDLNGRKVLELSVQTKVSKLNLEALQSGTYLLKIHDKELNTNITTIVQKIK